MLDELLKTQLHVVAGLLALWTIGGAAAGIVLALTSWFAGAKCGAWGWQWRHATWFRVLAALWLIAGFGALGAWAGLGEATLRGTERIVRQSQFRTEALERAGRYGALGIAWVDAALENSEAGRPIALTDDQWKRLEAFERGENEIEMAAFIGRLERAEERVVQEAAREGKERLRAKLGIVDNALVARAVEALFASLARRAVRGKVAEGLASAGVDAPEFFATLADAAKRSGDPARLSHVELSAHVVEHALIPPIVKPVRATVRVQQAIAAVLAAVALLVPVAAFAIARAVERRRATTSSRS